MPVITADNVQDFIAAYHDGTLDDETALELFAYMVKSKTVPKNLKWCADRLIQSGTLSSDGEILIPFE